MNKENVMKKVKNLKKKIIDKNASSGTIADAFLEWYDKENAGGKKSLIYISGMFYVWEKNVWKIISDDNIKLKIQKFMKQCCEKDTTGKTLSDVLINVKSECDVNSDEYKMPCFLDTKEDATPCIVFPNGYINTKEITVNDDGSYNFTLHEPEPNIFTTTQIATPFVADAECPKWNKYLEEVQPDAEDRDNLQMLMGYTLTRDTGKNVFFLFYGDGGTGKSVFVKVHGMILGMNNVSAVPLNECKDKFTNVALTEKLLNAVSESPMGDKNEVQGLDEALKKMTSGDPMEVQRKHGHPYTAIPTARMVFGANDKPFFSDKSVALWDRLRVFLFEKRIREEYEQIENLENIIIAEEASGVLLWALKGFVKLKGHKTFPQSKRCKEFVKHYRALCNPPALFLQDTVRIKMGGTVSTAELYAKYKQWATDNGFKVLSSIKFNDAVEKELNISRDRMFNEFGSRPNVWEGIEFKTM